MFSSTVDSENLYENLLASNSDSSYLDRALVYRSQLFELLSEYLNPQNFDSKAQDLQKELEQKIDTSNNDPVKALYYSKQIKAKILKTFIAKIFSRPQDFNLSFDTSPSYNDQLWTSQLLIDDFIYYGPVTILSLCPLLKEFEQLNENPLYQKLSQDIEYHQITEIRVNNQNDIFYEAVNRIFKWQIPFVSEEHLKTVIERIINEVNLLNKLCIKLNTSSPIADFEHPCGYIRASAVLPPAAEAPFLTLRIHPGEPYDLNKLISFGMLSKEMADFLIACQEAGTTIAIAGTMGSGKTTLLSALSEYWPDNGRKATIEDTPELRPKIDDLIKMRTIEHDRDDIQDIDVTRLTKACKRHSVRYVVLSEARDGSAWEILQLSQAILGCLMTFHYTLRSNNFLLDQALNTLCALCKQHKLAPQGLDMKHLIADMVQILILVEQSPIDSVRRITKIYYVTGFDELNGGNFKAVELFSFDQDLGFHLVNIASDFEDYLLTKGVKYKF